MDSTDDGPARLDPTLADAPARALPGAVVFCLRALALAAAYYLSARLGLLIPYVGTHISLVWLPTGIAVAAFWRWGPAMAPAAWVAAVAANASIGGPLWIALFVGVGNTAGTLLTARLLRRWGFDDRLARRRDITVFLGAVLIGMCVTSANGVFWLGVAGAPESAHSLQAWIGWLVGDAVGALLAGVPLISWRRERVALAFGGQVGARNLALQAVVLACGLTAFSGWLDHDTPFVYPLLALPFFLLALLAMRGGVIAASIGVLLLSVAAGYGTARGFGPFALRDPRAGSLALWSYITAQACTSLLICSLGMALQASQRQFTAFLQHTSDGILVIDEQGTLLHANAAFAAMTGIDAVAQRGRRAVDVLRGGGAAIAALVADGAPAAVTELAFARPGGEPLVVECHVARYRKTSGHWQTHVSLRDITPRIVARELLATSEARLKAVTDHVPAMFAYVDRQQVYRFANGHFRHVMGVEPEAVVGRTMREFLGDDAHGALLPHIEGALRGEAQFFERNGWKGNENTHFMVRYVPELRADGSVPGFFIMVLDITERHRAEVALARSEALVRAITDHMPGLISRIDRDYRYTFANANYVHWFKLPESPVGKTVIEVFGEATFADVRPRIDAALAGRDVVFELANPAPGEVGFMEVRYVPHRDEHGEVIGVYTLVTDRTEQQLARDRIEASERQLRAVTDNLPLLITYVDAEERLRFMNATFHEWLGVDLAAAIGRPLADVVGADNYAARREYLRAALSGRRVEFEVVSRTLQGPRDLKTIYIPDVRDDGSVHGIFTLGTDVTAQKDVERELQRLARVDTLTGLANRRQFDELLEQALARYRRARRPLALIYLDIDRFKAINDTHGHGVGDAVLREFAARLESGLRETDVAARLSGDEFVVILDGLGTRDEAVAVATKLLHAIRVPMALAGRTLPVTASMGLAYLDGTLEVDAQALMVRADRALYRAKAAGRNGLAVGED
jgi:diguanylate cyclase (GGDEF)-like protein/PAS domain S-box-containing protein